jgi:DNA-binding MarR family transcriptional regulator
MSRRQGLNSYAWVIRGKQRRKIIKIMDKPKIPTEIKDETKLSLNNVSDILRLFEKKKIAKCLNPKEKTGRLYELTEKGKLIRDMIIEK